MEATAALQPLPPSALVPPPLKLLCREPPNSPCPRPRAHGNVRFGRQREHRAERLRGRGGMVPRGLAIQGDEDSQ